MTIEIALPPIKWEAEAFPVEFWDDRQPPEGGWQEPCKLGDHKWTLEINGFENSFDLVCVDPCSEEKLATYNPQGLTPGCCSWAAEYILTTLGPFTLQGATDCPKRGYNDSGSHGYGCDCDHWVEIVEEVCPTRSS